MSRRDPREFEDRRRDPREFEDRGRVHEDPYERRRDPREFEDRRRESRESREFEDRRRDPEDSYERRYPAKEITQKPKKNMMNCFKDITFHHIVNIINKKDFLDQFTRDNTIMNSIFDE